MVQGRELLRPVDVPRLARRKGVYNDGKGLNLVVRAPGSASWVYRFTLDKRPRMAGLGPYPDVSLEQARRKVEAMRSLKADGVNPIEKRKEDRRAEALAAESRKNFETCTHAYVKAHRAGWKNAKHAKQWTATLARYAFPVFGDTPVRDIDGRMVLKVLQPIWATKNETASRVRGRIESVLDWAKVQGYREGENPARWEGQIKDALPARSRVQEIEHHAALPFEEIGAFMADLRTREGAAARALEFAILGAFRTSEVLNARWSEVNFDQKMIVIPAVRMKSKREHRVPLSPAALAVLDKMRPLRGKGDWIFPGQADGKPLSNMAMLATLRRMGRGDLTAHGFRSTFRDWVSETTDFPSELAEVALAHVIRDKTEAAYRRGDMFEKRRALTDAWADYCAIVREGKAT